MDLEIREFSQAIVNFINSSNLPIEVKRLCIKDIQRQIEEAALQEIQKQIAARDAKDKEKTEQTENNEEDGKDE